MERRRALQALRRGADLRPRLRALQAEQPFRGYRRSWAYRRFAEPLEVHQKRVLRLMREHHLVGAPHQKLKAKRPPPGRNPEPRRPNEWWGMDRTKVLVQGFGWMDIVAVLDWDAKQAAGYAAERRGAAQHWRVARGEAVSRQVPKGVRGDGLALVRDSGCQPPSLACMEPCSTLGSHQALTSDHNPKGNADTERFLRPLKEECLWLHEWTRPLTLVSACKAWIDGYNEHDLHSALGDKPPRQCEREDYISHGPPFVAA